MADNDLTSEWTSRRCSSWSVLPQKILKLSGSKMLFYTFSWRYKLFTSKIYVRKGKIINTKALQSLFQFLSCSAGVVENIHHFLTACSLCNYSLHCPETRTVKIWSCSKKPILSLNDSLELGHVLFHKK